MYALINGTVFIGEQVPNEPMGEPELIGNAVLIDRDRIHALLPQANLPSQIPTIDLQGYSIAPGFIDLQLNGCGGVMFNDTITAETLEIMHRTNLKSGTTSFLPTLITASDADMLKAIAVVAEYRHQSPYNILGLHLEGPYLNPHRKGIHNAAYVRSPDPAMLQKIAAAGREVVKLITLAPEMVQLEDIHMLAEAGILVAAGHTDATYEQAIAAFEAGVGMVTHLFNAMSPWQGRSPGVVGAALNCDVYAGMIADGHHVHFSSIQLAHKIKQAKLVLVTDATPAAGAALDSFMIGGQEVFYRDGKCISADGTLGGSALTMIAAVKNCVEQLDLPLAEVLRMASLYPAQAIAVDHELGKIAPGYIANLTIFDPNLQIVGVVDRGEYRSHLPAAN